MTAILQAAFRYFEPPLVPTPPLVQTTSLWFRLPLELREQIYSDFFADHALSFLYISPTEGSVFADPVAGGAHHTALLRTCKAIHAEALPILHANHRVHLLVSDSLVLSREPAPPAAAPTIYHPEMRVCSRRYMLWLLQHRLTDVTITVRLTTVSPRTLIVQKLAWLLEMLRRRENRLQHLKLHILNNLTVFSGCCNVTKYKEGSRWDVYPKVVVVTASQGGGVCKVDDCGCKLLEACAENWEGVVSMSEGRLAMGHCAPHLWERLSGDLFNVEGVLGEQRRWWEVTGSTDVWDSISENPDRFW